MIKKYLSILMCVLLLAILLVACSNNDGKTIQVFDATVIEHNGGLLVAPVEGSAELASADKIYVSLTNLEQENNESEELPKFKPGDLVRITYDGLIAESYPAQIQASKIELIDSK